MFCLYNRCLLSVLLYDSECWGMTKKGINKPSVLPKNCHRGIIKVCLVQLLNRYKYIYILVSFKKRNFQEIYICFEAVLIKIFQSPLSLSFINAKY